MYAGVHKTLALNNNCVYVTNYVLPPSINSKLHSVGADAPVAVQIYIGSHCYIERREEESQQDLQSIESSPFLLYEPFAFLR